MILQVRALDAVGDWTWGAGKNNYLTGNAAVAQNIRTRLYSVLNDCFFATADGIDWFNLLGYKNQTALNLAVSATILNTAYVTGITQLSVIVNAARNIQIIYNATTSFGNSVISTVNFTPNYLLTESGDVLVTESGEKILV